MPTFRFLVAATALAASVAVPALTSKNAVAPILSEVQKHLDDARVCVANGTPDVAAAHCDLVLIGDQIKYSVQFIDVPDRLQGNDRKALDGAIAAWSKALDDTVTFKQVDDPATANITIRFKAGVMMGKEPVAGFANWKRTLKSDGPKVDSVLFQSDIQVRTINVDGKAMPLDCVRHEIEHEVGHILGLEDVDQAGTLMGPLDVNNPVSRPHEAEIEAVKQLRDQAHQIRAQVTQPTQK